VSSTVVNSNIPANSIVNPNSNVYLDLNAPFNFFEFLKQTTANLSPIHFNQLYIDYLNDWNRIKNYKKEDSDNEIVARYTELLKEISLRYLTIDEKRFISNIDFNDPFDLDVVLPFYSKKLVDICDFYCKKREYIKGSTEKNKIKGTENSVQRALFETITDVIFVDVIETAEQNQFINLDSLYENLNIEVEELYDLYTNYLDNDPDVLYSYYDVTTENRKKYYSSNLNRIDANIFLNLDNAIKNQLLENLRVFLYEFGKNFSINFNLNSVNLNCKIGDPLYSLVSSNKDKAAILVTLRNSLITKYIGADFYYVATNEDIKDYTFDLLFKAENPSGNLLNRHFPTTASIEEESDLASFRRIGLFFTPEKNSILYFSVVENKYKIDFTKLEPNKIYIFPDPSLYGNTTGLTRKYYSEYPLIHIQDYSSTVKNKSYNQSDGDVKLTPKDQALYPYYSEHQVENLLTGDESLNVYFSRIVDKGLIDRWTSDVYGNEYCLIKPYNKLPIEDNTSIELSSINVCMDFDGGPIMFDRNGFLPEQVWTSNKKWVYPNVWASDYYYNLLIDGGFGGLPMGIMWHGLFSKLYIDGYSLARNENPEINFQLWFNPDISEDNLNLLDGDLYNSYVEYDYEINSLVESYNQLLPDLVDGLFYDNNYGNLLNEMRYTLDGNPNKESDSSPNFVRNTKYTLSAYMLSSIKYAEYDGGFIIDSCDRIYDFNEETNFIIRNRMANSYTLSAERNFQEKFEKPLLGSIFTKNIVTKEILPLSSALAVTFEKYSSEIKSEIYNKVIDFNVYDDFIWIRTDNYMIFDRISYEETSFRDPGTTLNFLRNSKLISDPFIFENKDYCLIASLSISNVNTINYQNIFPVIKKFSFNDYILIDVYDGSTETNLYDTGLGRLFKYKFINTPKCFYNSRNNLYGFLTTIEDQNGFPSIYKLSFEYNESKVDSLSCSITELYEYDYIRTINFHDNNSFSSAGITFNSIDVSGYGIDQANNMITFY
jgi:hypothetical protein